MPHRNIKQSKEDVGWDLFAFLKNWPEKVSLIKYLSSNDRGKGQSAGRGRNQGRRTAGINQASPHL